MTAYVKRMMLINMLPEARYTYIAAALGVSGTLADLAIKRLVCGDVRPTQYGIRVAVNEALGDDRTASGGDAYWPESTTCCRCWSMKTRGECSHALAAELYRVNIDDILDAIDVTGYSPADWTDASADAGF